jgi:hypothetical protein
MVQYRSHTKQWTPAGGARGILDGTTAVLEVFDDQIVRRIVEAANGLIDSVKKLQATNDLAGNLDDHPHMWALQDKIVFCKLTKGDRDRFGSGREAVQHSGLEPGSSDGCAVQGTCRGPVQERGLGRK